MTRLTPIDTPGARATVRCTVTASGRACLRLDYQQVGDSYEFGGIAVVYPNPGSSSTFRAYALTIGGNSGGASCTDACPVWSTHTSQVLATGSVDRLDRPASDSWLPAGAASADGELKVDSDAGPLTIDVSWPAP